MTNARPSIAGLYAIADTGYLPDADLAWAVEQAILGGARLIQYRDKSGNRATRHDQAARLQHLCHRHAVPLIINDDVELAAASAATGVHLGRHDSAPGRARAVLGPDAVIGVSCYDDIGRARAAQSEGADYVAFGSFFASRTKPAAVSADPELLRRARATLAIPLVAIGGITPENGGALIAAGASALAVVEGVFARSDIQAAARRYARLFEGATRRS